MLFFAAAFVVLLVVGVSLEELEWPHAALLLVLALLGGGAFYLFRWPPLYFLALLGFADAVLALYVFKGNVPVIR